MYLCWGKNTNGRYILLFIIEHKTARRRAEVEVLQFR